MIMVAERKHFHAKQWRWFGVLKLGTTHKITTEEATSAIKMANTMVTTTDVVIETPSV